jgi:hypothetical protein
MLENPVCGVCHRSAAQTLVWMKQYVKVQRHTNTNIGCVHTYMHTWVNTSILPLTPPPLLQKKKETQYSTLKCSQLRSNTWQCVSTAETNQKSVCHKVQSLSINSTEIKRSPLWSHCSGAPVYGMRPTASPHIGLSLSPNHCASTPTASSVVS